MQKRNLPVIVFLFFLTMNEVPAQDLDVVQKLRESFPISVRYQKDKNEKKLEGELGGGIDFGFGRTREYVFDNTFGFYPKQLLSMLNWPIENEVNFFLLLKLKTKYGLIFQGRFGAGVSHKSGNIEDFDWLNVQINPSRRELTNYSVHENFSAYNFYANICFSKQFLMPQSKAMKKKNVFLFIAPMLRLDYVQHQWESKNGYIQYSAKVKYGDYEALSSSVPKIVSHGKAIDYAQRILMPAIGLEILLKAPRGFEISFECSGAPALYANCLDIHWARDLIFNDIMKSGWNISACIRMCKKLPHALVVFGETKIAFASGKNGVTYCKQQEGFFLLPSISGTDFLYGGISFGLMYHFETKH
ncbi:hypothetical protein HMPREF9554_02142 [Treponema phagedenis F0421]|uniref:omptin family outer membrane protease n=1 Tax=Treponema phagedenis TaxID=162 RepID=UPI0001F63D3A|nr:omptin family outer membrane protease [Treponema phagedenis]EFW37383.1 hypothetical protein HMPREF9554_02142 [Treponema phagedenis F0421]